MPVRLFIAAALLGLISCSGPQHKMHDYQIVIQGSITSDPVEFAGSYSFEQNGQEITRDLSGAGSFSVSVQSHQLKRVWVQGLLGGGKLSLSVYEDGVALFESSPSDSSKPLLFTYEPQEE